MNIDQLLRETLRSYAGAAPPNTGLAHAARARGRHHRRVRAVSLAGSAAAAAAAIAAPVLLLGPGSQDPTVPAGPPPTSLAPASYELPTFPFTPGWTPDGFGDPQLEWSADVTVDVDGGLSTEQRELVHHGESDGSSGAPVAPTLKVQVWPADPAADFAGGEAEEVPATVQERPGRLFTDRWRAAVIWEHEADQWLMVTGWDVPADDVLQYADALLATPFEPVPPFQFGRLPAGAELRHLSPDQMSFAFGDGGDFTATRMASASPQDSYMCVPAPSPGPEYSHAPTTAPSAPPLPDRSSDRTLLPTMDTRTDLTVLPTMDTRTDLTVLPTMDASTVPGFDWRREAVAGWGEATLVEAGGTITLCLVIGAGQQEIVVLAGTLRDDDLIAVAEEMRLNE